MSKVILLSIVLVSIATPIILCTRTAARPALRLTQWITFGFILVWAYMCIAWYPQMVHIE